MFNHRSSHTHCQAAQAKLKPKLAKDCVCTNPERISKFFSPFFKKKLKHANTRAS